MVKLASVECFICGRLCSMQYLEDGCIFFTFFSLQRKILYVLGGSELIYIDFGFHLELDEKDIRHNRSKSVKLINIKGGNMFGKHIIVVV